MVYSDLPYHKDFHPRKPSAISKVSHWLRLNRRRGLYQYVIFFILLVVVVVRVAGHTNTSDYLEEEAAVAQKALKAFRSKLSRSSKTSFSDTELGIDYYDLNDFQGNPDGSTKGDLLLMLIPLRNAAPVIPMMMSHLANLTYPHDLIDVAFLISDTSDTTLKDLRYFLHEYRSDEENVQFNSITILQKDFGQIVGQGFDDRHGVAVQGQRRKLMGRARNWLLSATLQPYHSWVFWRDADVETCPGTIIEDMMKHNQDVIVPNVWRPLPDWLGGEQPYDLNAWQESDAALKLAQSLDEDDVIVEGYAEYTTWRPHMAYFRSPDGNPDELMDLDGIGGVSLLAKAKVFRSGANFPGFALWNHAETEGFGKLCRKMGFSVSGLVHYTIWHQYEPSEEDLKEMKHREEEAKAKAAEEKKEAKAKAAEEKKEANAKAAEEKKEAKELGQSQLAKDNTEEDVVNGADATEVVISNDNKVLAQAAKAIAVEDARNKLVDAEVEAILDGAHELDTGAVVEDSIAKGPTAKDPTAKDAIAKGPTAKEPIAREPIAMDPIIKSPTIKGATAEDAKGPIAKDSIAKDATAKGATAKDSTVKGSTVKDAIVKDSIAKDAIAKKPSTEDSTAKDITAKDSTAKGITAKGATDKGALANTDPLLQLAEADAVEVQVPEPGDIIDHSRLAPPDNAKLAKPNAKTDPKEKLRAGSEALLDHKVPDIAKLAADI